MFEGVEVFEEEQPGDLLGVVEFTGAAGVLVKDVVDVFERLFKHKALLKDRLLEPGKKVNFGADYGTIGSAYAMKLRRDGVSLRPAAAGLRRDREDPCVRPLSRFGSFAAQSVAPGFLAADPFHYSGCQ
jgi:hypothetical protein